MLNDLKNKMEMMASGAISFHPAVEVTNPCSDIFCAHGLVLHGGKLKVLDCIGYGHELNDTHTAVVAALEERVNQIMNAKMSAA